MTHDPGHTPDREPPPPSIPDLDLVRRIGRGGFGEVWLGINRATGGLKAVKVVPLARGGRKVDPAGREVVSLAQFESQQIGRHPNLLDVQHVGRTDDVLFMLMDPADDVSGKPATNDAVYRPATLELRLEQGPLAADECLRCARQLVAGLAHLHAAGMVHRDVKPSNCLFVNHELKLADFGLLSPAVPQLSRLGTVRYMPPDGRMDLRADVYAAGLVIYEMLTGLPAEAFPRLGERAREIAADPRLAQLNRVALAAASRDHHARPAHAGELLAAVDTAAAASPRAAGRFRRRAVAAAVLVAAVVPATLAISLLLASLSMSTTPARRDRPPEVTAAVVPATAAVVNFITEPLGAAVLIDGTPYRDADGATSTTPVTLPVPAGGHRVTFQHPERGTLDAGRVNFDTIREVIARWP